MNCKAIVKGKKYERLFISWSDATAIICEKDKHRQIQELVFSQTSLKIYGLYRDEGGRKVACVYIQSYNPTPVKSFSRLYHICN